MQTVPTELPEGQPSPMILTQCAVCAAPLGLALGKKCSRCSTCYCGPACQAQHWKKGGHDKLCKKIKKGGGAEQNHADQKYIAAVAVAVEKCAADTKGQTCDICTEALHWKTKEGLVRGCACRGTAGFAHVSCLAEQAKILVAEAEENKLGDKVLNERWGRWDKCGLCEQKYHGVVFCVLGWACWKTYVGRPETDQLRGMAMGELGSGLNAAQRFAEALLVREAELSMMQRLGDVEENMLAVQGNLANTYESLGRYEESTRIRQDVYAGTLRLCGEEHRDTLIEALNYAFCLNNLEFFEDAKSLMRKTIPVARRVLGDNNILTLKMRWVCALALFLDTDATLDDLSEAVTTLEEIERIARRVLGGAHPFLAEVESVLRKSLAALRRQLEAV